jgi:hypothetical protein
MALCNQQGKGGAGESKGGASTIFFRCKHLNIAKNQSQVMDTAAALANAAANEVC